MTIPAPCLLSGGSRRQRSFVGTSFVAGARVSSFAAARVPITAALISSWRGLARSRAEN